MMSSSTSSPSLPTNVNSSSLSSINLVYLSDLISLYSENSKNLTLSRILLDSSSQLNKYSINCPNPKCRSLILRPFQVSCSSLSTEEMFFPPLPSSILPSSTHPLSASTFFFCIPNKMTFENIGFSNPSQNAKQIRYLSCADCDIGPLGFVQNETCLLDANRVRYGRPSV